MTANTNLVEISCDGPDGRACPEGVAWSDYGTAQALRERMRQDGWKTGLPGGKDRCPSCSQKQVGGDSRGSRGAHSDA